MTDRDAPPALSVVVLTRNERANVEDAVRSLLSQEGVPLEVVVVDSASTDGTLDVLRELEPRARGRLRVVASERDVPIGEARNMGIAEARGRIVAFMSADATAAPGWAEEMLESLHDADVVYGRQEHAPPRLNVAAVVRGLRYHHFGPSAPALSPESYASNVNAGIRREVFDRVRYVDEGPASALDDVLFTREAQALGFRVAYNPRMLVRHKDVSDLRGELRKNKREGYGWGLLEPALGANRVVIVWGAALALALVLLLLSPTALMTLLLLALLAAPALRRIAKAGAPFLKRAPLALLGALLVSPLFDLVFLLNYLRGLKDRRPDLSGVVRPHGA